MEKIGLVTGFVDDAGTSKFVDDYVATNKKSFELIRQKMKK
ncbi:MAG: hypothetical protein QGG84_09220 [Rhodospirillales bacterium]|jgi:hypothetical protein|nr:hypothetical protein [Rhodospirillales bacterium]MDP6927254.1 hypothetical protein [Rhodospirillales bacterium]